MTQRSPLKVSPQYRWRVQQRITVLAYGICSSYRIVELVSGFRSSGADPSASRGRSSRTGGFPGQLHEPAVEKPALQPPPRHLTCHRAFPSVGPPQRLTSSPR